MLLPVLLILFSVFPGPVQSFSVCRLFSEQKCEDFTSVFTIDAKVVSTRIVSIRVVKNLVEPFKRPVRRLLTREI